MIVFWTGLDWKMYSFPLFRMTMLQVLLRTFSKTKIDFLSSTLMGKIGIGVYIVRLESSRVSHLQMAKRTEMSLRNI